MAFSAKKKLQPFFFDTTVNQVNYTDMLKNHLLPQLRSKRIMSTTTFQHFSQRAREFVSNHTSEDYVIGRGFGHTWPPRSPDLSPVDYY